MSLEAFVVGVSLGLIAGFILGLFPTVAGWKQETVNRGYAQYCPMDGQWAWKGECDGNN